MNTDKHGFFTEENEGNEETTNELESTPISDSDLQAARESELSRNSQPRMDTYSHRWEEDFLQKGTKDADRQSFSQVEQTYRIAGQHDRTATNVCLTTDEHG
jgi:hypothetical protein